MVRGYREDASRAGSYPGDEHHARVDSGVGARRRGREGKRRRGAVRRRRRIRRRRRQTNATEIYTARRHRGVEASPRDARGTSGGARRRRGGRRGRRPGQTRRRERRARRRARVRETFWDALGTGTKTKTEWKTRRCDEDRETRRCDEDAVVSVRLGRVPGLHRSDARVRASRVGVVRRVAAVDGGANRRKRRPRPGGSPSCSTPRTTPSTGTDW